MDRVVKNEKEVDDRMMIEITRNCDGWWYLMKACKSLNGLLSIKKKQYNNQYKTPKDNKWGTDNKKEVSFKKYY